MWLRNPPVFAACPRLNNGGTRSRAPFAPHRATFWAIAGVLLVLATPGAAAAQQANQPGFDPRQTEKYFDDRQSGPERPLQPPPQTPTLARPEVTASRKPLFVLRAVS